MPDRLEVLTLEIQEIAPVLCAPDTREQDEADHSKDHCYDGGGYRSSHRSPSSTCSHEARLLGFSTAAASDAGTSPEVAFAIRAPRPAQKPRHVLGAISTEPFRVIPLKR